jgi:hypothetical protein
MAVRNYFREYAVTADREIEISRRKVLKKRGGSPGSEVDVLCRFPARGVVSTDPIALPIEVKLSHNPEALTGLRDQLVNRYMTELGTSYGVYVVVWMGAPLRGARYKPCWKSLSEAKADLERQAADATDATEGMCVRVFVVDASLPIIRKPQKAPKRLAKRKKPTRHESANQKKAAAPVRAGHRKQKGKPGRAKNARANKRKKPQAHRSTRKRNAAGKRKGRT